MVKKIVINKPINKLHLIEPMKQTNADILRLHNGDSIRYFDLLYCYGIYVYMYSMNRCAPGRGCCVKSDSICFYKC